MYKLFFKNQYDIAIYILTFFVKFISVTFKLERGKLKK